MVRAIFAVKIKPGHREHLLQALTEPGRIAAATEAGLRRFDMYPDPHDPNRLGFYEAYVDEEALNMHLQGLSHIEKWLNFGREHCVDEWPPAISTGRVHSIWTPEDGDRGKTRGRPQPRRRSGMDLQHQYRGDTR